MMFLDETMTAALILIGILLTLGLLIVAIQLRSFFTVKSKIIFSSRKDTLFCIKHILDHKKHSPHF